MYILNFVKAHFCITCIRETEYIVRNCPYLWCHMSFCVSHKLINMYRKHAIWEATIHVELFKVCYTLLQNLLLILLDWVLFGPSFEGKLSNVLGITTSTRNWVKFTAFLLQLSTSSWVWTLTTSGYFLKPPPLWIICSDHINTKMQIADAEREQFSLLL